MLDNQFVNYCKLITIQEGSYTQYVFENLEESNIYLKYIWCTKVPNWQMSNEFSIGDCGYLHYKYVNAGDTYFHSHSQENRYYRYDACYFIDFLKEKKIINNKEFNF